MNSLKQTFLPFLSWIHELKDREVLKNDIIAGTTVALVLIPQSMAYASLAGLPAYIGLYASFLPVMVAAFFGSSRQLATGPVAIVSIMTAAALEPLATGNPEGYIAYAALLALIVGVFQLSLGLLKLGVIVNFLSHPVVVGFTNAGAIIIATSQLSKIFGVSAPTAEHHYEIVYGVLENAYHNTHLPTLLIGIGSILLLALLKKFAKKLPGVLITVVVFTVVSAYIGFEQAGGKVIGSIPEGLPSFTLPVLNLDIILSLISAAITISLVGFMEAISIAKSMAAQSKQGLSANQELVGQGLSNIVAGFFSGYPVSGSFSRSAVNFSSGAKTGFSSVVTGVIIAISLLFLTPLIYHLPQATLATIIIMAVVNLVKIEPIIHAWKIQKHDAIASIATFVATLYFAPNLEEGIILGVILSLGLFLYRSMKPRFIEVSMHKSGMLREAVEFGLATSDTVGIYRFDGPLYFASAGYFEGKLLKFVSEKPKLKVIVLDFEAIQEIDATGQEAIETMIEKLEKWGITVTLARLKQSHFKILEWSHFFDHYDRSKVFHKRHDALAYAKEQFGDAIDIEPLNTYTPKR